MAKSAEFILEFEAKQLLVLEPFGPYYEDAVQRFSEQPDLQVVECTSLNEIASLARQIGVCVILAHCQGEPQADDFVNMIEACFKEIRERKIRVVITVSNDFLILQPRFVRAGATEVIPQPISPKLLYGKIDRYLNILPSRNQYGKLIPPKPRPSGTGADLSDEPQITWQVPLNLKSDCWMTIEGKTRWVSKSGKWSVTLIGPPPSYGEWTPSARMPGIVPSAEEPTWEWIPTGLTDDPFIHEDGTWKYRGDKPEFKEGAWVFQGQFPKLAFLRKEEGKGTKVEGDHESLMITETSPQAIRASELIEESLRENNRIASAEAEVSGFQEATESEVAEDTAGASDPVSGASAATGSPAETPDYLRRVSSPSQNPSRSFGDELPLNPVALAFFVSEMMQSRAVTPERILVKACEHLQFICRVAVVELWISGRNGWRCIQHKDLMDMALQQRIEQSSPYERCVRVGDYHAAIFSNGQARIGALVVSGLNSEQFGDRELEGFAKAMQGVMLGFVDAAA